MQLDLDSFTDKASKNPEELALYQATDDYVAAYSSHTDLRIRRDGPHQAIGGDWETHGPLQLGFLQGVGMTRQTRLLDLGCGTGRLARHVVWFLDPGNYTGLDISAGALEHARGLAASEGWADRDPTFLQGDGSLAPVKDRDFDLVWAHSVFTHLPEDYIRSILRDLSQMRFGHYWFTYKRRPKPMRTGLKQFGYPPEWFVEAARAVGLRCEESNVKWPQGQSGMHIWQ